MTAAAHFEKREGELRDQMNRRRCDDGAWMVKELEQEVHAFSTIVIMFGVYQSRKGEVGDRFDAIATKLDALEAEMKRWDCSR
jgi:hypothetical protein